MTKYITNFEFCRILSEGTAFAVIVIGDGGPKEALLDLIDQLEEAAEKSAARKAE